MASCSRAAVLAVGAILGTTLLSGTAAAEHGATPAGGCPQGSGAHPFGVAHAEHTLPGDSGSLVDHNGDGYVCFLWNPGRPHLDEWVVMDNVLPLR